MTFEIGIIFEAEVAVVVVAVVVVAAGIWTVEGKIDFENPTRGFDWLKGEG